MRHKVRRGWRARGLALSGAWLALCVLSLASPTTARAQQAEAPACTASLDGHVVDAVTHEPIPGAQVSADRVAVAITDGAGRFHLEPLCPGELLLEIERADYQRERRVIPVAGAALSLEIELREGTSEVILIEGETPTEIDMRSTAVVSGEDLERTRGRSFSDTLAEVPGVTQLRSASGLAKPIVRGQFGRRLLVLVDSVRHRSQDWGLDHAPEIDPFIADEIAVVRGAAGVRYGPDAIGGAILVEPPKLLRQPGFAGELHLIAMPGRGGSLAGRVQSASARLPGLAWQLEGSLKRLASPATPDYALDNTGSREWNLGATAGYRAGADVYELSYRHYQAKLGVCSCLRIESSEDFFAQLEADRPVDADLYRSDFAIDRPYQAVDHDLALARGRWLLRSIGTLTASYALQYDHRREFDMVRNATGPQFDFRLTTSDLDLVLDHKPLHINDHLHLRGSVGIVGMAQVHGYGGLTLVPDHRAFGAGAYAIERLVGHDFELEAGVRYDALVRTASFARRDFLRLVRGGQLAMDACADAADANADPVDCSSTFHTISASLGGLVQLTNAWSAKLDLSTASRPPNPDEQYLSGTSPTFPVLGLGKPDLGAETTYSASATTTYLGAKVSAEASVFANHVSDYIYFAPALDDDGEPIFDVLIRGTFPRFVFRPVDAVFYGADGGVAVTPIPELELGAQISLVRARNMTDDAYLSFVPPDRLRGSATYTVVSGADEAFASIGGTYVTRQSRYDPAADLAPPPDAYFLLDAEIGAETRVFDRTLKVALQGQNLLDTRYRDYTSLLRYFADQPGWQAMVRLSLHFSSLSP